MVVFVEIFLLLKSYFMIAQARNIVGRPGILNIRYGENIYVSQVKVVSKAFSSDINNMAEYTWLFPVLGPMKAVTFFTVLERDFQSMNGPLKAE